MYFFPMRFFADLHIHSKYSRATSRECDLEHLWLWAQLKGQTYVWADVGLRRERFRTVEFTGARGLECQCE